MLLGQTRKQFVYMNLGIAIASHCPILPDSSNLPWGRRVHTTSTESRSFEKHYSPPIHKRYRSDRVCTSSVSRLLFTLPRSRQCWSHDGSSHQPSQDFVPRRGWGTRLLSAQFALPPTRIALVSIYIATDHAIRVTDQGWPCQQQLPICLQLRVDPSLIRKQPDAQGNGTAAAAAPTIPHRRRHVWIPAKPARSPRVDRFNGNCHRPW